MSVRPKFLIGARLFTAYFFALPLLFGVHDEFHHNHDDEHHSGQPVQAQVSEDCSVCDFVYIKSSLPEDSYSSKIEFVSVFIQPLNSGSCITLFTPGKFSRGPPTA